MFPGATRARTSAFVLERLQILHPFFVLARVYIEEKLMRTTRSHIVDPEYVRKSYRLQRSPPHTIFVQQMCGPVRMFSRTSQVQTPFHTTAVKASKAVNLSAISIFSQCSFNVLQVHVRQTS
jgi:hypothetical protein